MENLIICTVASGIEYVISVQKYYKQLKIENFNVKVFTDLPEYFNDEDVVIYNKPFFNYFDKLFFCIDIVEKYKTNVLYFDAKNIHNNYWFDKKTIESYISKSKDYHFTYPYSWPHGGFDYYKNNKVFKYLLDYMEYRKIPIIDYQTIHEKVFFFSKDIDVKLLRRELEIIKPVFDYVSIMKDATYQVPFRLGCAEGLALSIVLERNNIPFKKINP